MSSQSSNTKKTDNKEISLSDLKEIIIKVLKKHGNKVSLAQINTFVKKEEPNFSIRNYGVSRFKTLIEKTNWPEIQFDNKNKPNFIVLKK